MTVEDGGGDVHLLEEDVHLMAEYSRDCPNSSWFMWNVENSKPGVE